MASSVRRILQAAAALLALSVGGCSRGPSMLWLGKTPDRERRVVIADGPDGQQLFIGGQLRSQFDGIAARTLVWSGDGRHFAVAVQREQGWSVVRDGQPASVWQAVAELSFAPEAPSLAYAAERDGRWHVVVDERVGPPFDSILSGSLRASGDGEVWAYAAERAGSQLVVVGQTPGSAYDAVGELSITADGRHVAYTARRGQRAYFVLDGNVGPAYDRASDLVLTSRGELAGVARLGNRSFPVLRTWAKSPELRFAAAARVSGLVLSSSEQHMAWKASSAAGVGVVRDGVLLDTHAAVQAAPLAFRPGRALLAYVAKQADGSQLVVIDDVPVGPWDEVASDGVAFSKDGRRAGFSARRGPLWHVVVDGQTIARESWASSPSFSDDGLRQAHVARRDGHMIAVVDGVGFPFDLVVEGTFGFSRDGQHWACVAGSLATRHLFFVVDGRPAGELDFRELVSSVDGIAALDVYRGRLAEVLRQWTAAEAEAGTRAQVHQSVQGRARFGAWPAGWP